MCLRDRLINDPEKRFLNDLQSILQSTTTPHCPRGVARRDALYHRVEEPERKNKKFVIPEW